MMWLLEWVIGLTTPASVRAVSTPTARLQPVRSRDEAGLKRRDALAYESTFGAPRRTARPASPRVPRATSDAAETHRVRTIHGRAPTRV